VNSATRLPVSSRPGLGTTVVGGVDVDELGEGCIEVDVVLVTTDPRSAEWHEPAAAMATAAMNTALRESTLVRR